MAIGSPADARKDVKRQIALMLWSGELGGAETFTAELAAAFRRADVDARILFLKGAGPLAARLDDWGVPYVALGYRFSKSAPFRMRRFAAALAAAGPDGAVLCTTGWPASVLRLGGYKAPLVGVEHGQLAGFGVPPTGIRRAASVNSRLQLELGRRTLDAMVAVSPAVRERLVARGVPDGMIETIPCGVDLRAYPDVGMSDGGDGPLRAVSMSRLFPGKGLDYLIRAVAEIGPETPVHLDIWGSGVEMAPLTQEIERLGLGSAVDLRGTTVRPYEVLADSDVVVVPSAECIESFGRAAVEAMACGKPVVATRNGGLPGIVADGESGVLVEPCSPSALARALVRYQRDPELRARHGVAGRARVQAVFDIDQCAREYLSLITLRS